MNRHILPVIEIYQGDEHTYWHWSVSHPHHGELLGHSVNKFHDRQECIENLKVFGRLITAFAVAEEAAIKNELAS